MTKAQRLKQKQRRLLPDYIMTDEEFKWYKYCCDNAIRISPVAPPDNEPGKWNIGISTPDDHKKIYRSPELCDKDTVWPVFHKYTKYYYDRRTISGTS